MNRSDRLIFKTWEHEVITAEKEKALKVTEVTIKEERAIDARIQAANQEEKAIDARIQVANQNIQTKSQVAEAANQEEKAIDARIQVANQEEKAIDARIQVANQQAEKLVALNAKLAEPI